VLARSRVLALFGSAPAFACARPAAAQVPAGTRLRVGAATSDSYLEPYFAADQGIFAKNGFNVELTPFPNSAAIVQAAAGGAIDLGMADMIQLGTAVLHGVPFGFFAGAALYSSDAPTTVLCVAKNSAFRTAKDLEGQAVGVVALTSQSAVATTEWLRANGADVAKVKMFELPFPAMAPALARGTVAAALIGEPFVNFARADVRVFAKPFDIIAKSFYIGAWFASRDWAKGNADLLRRFSETVYETARWSNSHQPETLQTLSSVAKVEIERVRTMNRVVWATSLDPRLMQPVLDIAAKYKLIDRPIAATDLILKT
jgi:NitT/TauT family transport system substrate-binding protein